MPNETTKQSSAERRNSCNRDTLGEYLERCTYFSMLFHVIPGQSGSRLRLELILAARFERGHVCVLKYSRSVPSKHS